MPVAWGRCSYDRGSGIESCCYTGWCTCHRLARSSESAACAASFRPRSLVTSASITFIIRSSLGVCCAWMVPPPVGGGGIGKWQCPTGKRHTQPLGSHRWGPTLPARIGGRRRGSSHCTSMARRPQLSSLASASPSASPSRPTPIKPAAPSRRCWIFGIVYYTKSL
jgi:hypothetical protein